MSIEVIGKQIATLRKEKGFKQEELANYVGVSTQAVSKWENGGVPDTELLPQIADFFSVSVDYLFGRNKLNNSEVQTSLCTNIIETSAEYRFKTAFNYCWDMERALFGNIPFDGSIEDYENNLDKNAQRYSSIMTDYGFTRMGIANKLQYFLIVPEIENKETALFEGINYIEFFRDFSDKNVFDTCVFLSKRENNNAFTEKLMCNNLKIEKEQVNHIISILKKYNLFRETKIELDDEIKTVYNFNQSPSFTAFLIFAREMIKAPNNFSYYCGNRQKPYL